MSSVVASIASASVAAPSIAAAVTPPTWPAQEEIDVQLFELWAERKAAADAQRQSHEALREVEAKLPEWARSGPEFSNSDGSFSGKNVAWPRLDAERIWLPPLHHQHRWPVLTRLSPSEVRQKYKNAVEPGRGCRTAAWREFRQNQRLYRDLLLAAIEERCKERSAEEKKLGIPGLYRAHERIIDRVLEAEAKIFELSPCTPNSIAAAVLIETAHECVGLERLEQPSDSGALITERVLKMLRPQLSGSIADDVAELLDNPSKPIPLMAFWPHDNRRWMKAMRPAA